MFKRLFNFLLLANGITPTGHKEQDKWAKIRADRERWEQEQRATQQGGQLQTDPPSGDRRVG